MRFRFCRDCDCPDWLLAEILTLSKIKPSTLKELSSLVAGSICGNDLNYEHICQLLSDTKFDEPSIRTSTAALRWILSNATAALIDAQILDSELQQLGLPKEQSEALKETFHAQKNVLKESLKEQTLKASGKVNWSYDIKGIQVGAEKEPVLQLNVEGKILDENKGFRVHDNASDGMEETEKMSIYMSCQQVGTLINELEEVYRCMKEIKPF